MLRSHNSNNTVKCKVCETNFFDIPVECIRKTRALNINPKHLAANEEIYRILRSSNGKKLFT
ncbi:MAG: hypothetical protein COW92_02555 [Candidatus Omnitrophica bacterium CG22_combo_CG10-13_8_21_14_all_43_16]|nr:MAG: hypothetical protein COW92_02555 [Candidatus Omnitrophica bacterium CG22_combo_CG10-13_8_21_14_all_43_16]